MLRSKWAKPKGQTSCVGDNDTHTPYITLKKKISRGQTHICNVVMGNNDNCDYSEYNGGNKDDNAGSYTNHDYKNYSIVIITPSFHLQHPSDLCELPKYGVAHQMP
jgi:hypothetical protein